MAIGQLPVLPPVPLPPSGLARLRLVPKQRCPGPVVPGLLPCQLPVPFSPLRSGEPRLALL